MRAEGLLGGSGQATPLGERTSYSVGGADRLLLGEDGLLGGADKLLGGADKLLRWESRQATLSWERTGYLGGADKLLRWESG